MEFEMCDQWVGRSFASPQYSCVTAGHPSLSGTGRYWQGAGAVDCMLSEGRLAWKKREWSQAASLMGGVSEGWVRARCVTAASLHTEMRDADREGSPTAGKREMDFLWPDAWPGTPWQDSAGDNGVSLKRVTSHGASGHQLKERGRAALAADERDVRGPSVTVTQLGGWNVCSHARLGTSRLLRGQGSWRSGM